MTAIIYERGKAAFEPGEVFRLSLAPRLEDAAGEHAVELKPASGTNRIAYLVGSDLNRQIVHDRTEPIYNQGSTDCDRLRVTDPERFHRVHVTKGYFRQPFRYRLDGYDCLLNLVTDPDQHPRVLRNMARLVQGYTGKIVNHPATVLRSAREQVALRAAGLAGVLTPKVLRLASSSRGVVRVALAKADLAFPVLARVAGTHGGRFLGRFADFETLAAALVPGQDHVLSEFVDYRSDDGLYRKYRMFFFGSRRVFRHMLVADHWNVHAGNGNPFMVRHPALLAEERAIFADPDARLGRPAITALEDIRRTVGLDFMGIDFGFTRDRELVLFEANATMNFFPFFADERVAYRQSCLEPAQCAFETLIGLR